MTAHTTAHQRTSWPQSDDLPPDAFAINTAVERFDAMAHRMEAKWGVGRLPTLVPQEMAERWARHIEKLNAALANQDTAAVRALVDGAERGWAAMEQAAAAAGHAPLTPEVWEVRMPSNPNRVIQIVRSNAEAAEVLRDGIDVEIWTLEEVANVIDGLGKIPTAVKHAWPGAKVTQVGKTDDLNDEIPL